MQPFDTVMHILLDLFLFLCYCYFKNNTNFIFKKELPIHTYTNFKLLDGEGRGSYYVFFKIPNTDKRTRLGENEKPQDFLFLHCKNDLLQLASK